MNNKHPNLLIVGVQKAGTSYLCSKLSQHKDIYFSNPKELLFFQKKNLNNDDFNDYIHNNFSDATDEIYRGEGSTVYLQWPNAKDNIKFFLGIEQKIIACLRHPTDRALSFYLHNYKKGRFDGSEDILCVGNSINLSPTLSSMYSEHIEKWLDAYKDNIEFILFDDLLKSPTQFVRQATDFLNLKPFKTINEEPVNKGFNLIWEGDNLTLKVPENRKTKPFFSLNQLEKLHEMFTEDIEKTEKLINRSLTDWKIMPEFTAKQKNW